MIDHLIFDLDGTLVDSASICTEILNAMLSDRDAGRVIPLHEAVPFMSRGGAHMITGLLAEHCEDPAADLLEFRQRYAACVTPRSSLFAGVREGLRELESYGYSLAICSNKPQNLCDKVVDDLGLEGLFTTVVGTRPGLRPKPYTDLLDLTLHQLGAQPERCVFIGDSDLDQSIARAGGLPFLFVSYGYADEAMRTERLVRFSCFTDLVDWVKVTYGGSQRLRNVA